MTSIDRLRNDMRQGRVTPATPLVDLRYIGAYVAGRLADENMLTVGDLARGTRGMSLPRVRTLLTEAAANRRANQCVRGYHVRDVNRLAYNTLVNLLAAARREWGLGYGPTLLPDTHPSRSPAAALCGCLATQAQCATRPDCRWAMEAGGAGAALCVPRAANARGFEGVGARTGQRRDARLRTRGAQLGQQRYVQGWRVPDAGV